PPPPPPFQQKNLLRYLISKSLGLVIAMCLLTTSCVDETNFSGKTVDPIQEKTLRTFTSIQKDDFLRSLQDGNKLLSFGSRKQDGESDFLGRANWAKAYKHENQVSGELTYTIPLISNGPEEFGNLIIVKNGETTNSYVLNYIPEQKWLETKKRRHGFGNYSGIVQLINLNGEIFSETRYLEGDLVTDQGINARTSGCKTEIIVTGYTTVCVDNQCIISEVRYAEVEICETQSTDGGGDVNNGDGSGGGGGLPDQNLGTPGPLDPADIAYWLTPVLAGDDLTNPYHGMKAKAKDGTIYTYDANINGWLMPDVIVLEENGYTPNYFLSPSANFDGGIISTMIIVAVAEPTPIGEVILGGFALSLYLYQWAQVADAEFPNEACLDFFEECQRWNSFYFTNLDCSSCVKLCYDSKTGQWPFNLCPIGY
ncbi:hypothetical protein, partial [Algoriphagus sp.]